jgi:hypothetical protein
VTQCLTSPAAHGSHNVAYMQLDESSGSPPRVKRPSGPIMLYPLAGLYMLHQFGEDSFGGGLPFHMAMTGWVYPDIVT